MGNPKAWTKLQKDDTRPMTLHQKCTVKRRLIQFGIKKSYLKKKRIPATLSKHTFKVHLSPNSLSLILFQERIHPS